MRDRRAGRAWAARAGVAILAATATVGLAGAQEAPGRARPATKTVRGKAPAAPPKGEPAKKPAPAADPLADPKLLPPGANPAPGTFHFRLKFRAPDGIALTANYYPSKLGIKAPVLLLVHEKDRSSKDFEDPVIDLKGRGLAEHMQGLGYAVMTFDLRGHGANVRSPLTPQSWRMMVDDLQAAYVFLLDRHNRGELNLAQLGVLGLGEGANLVAAWAASPAGGVSSEGRVTSDIAAMVLVSPMSDGEGLVLSKVVADLASRFPLMLMAGEGDPASSNPVRAVAPLVERTRLNKVEFFPSKLHGYKLLRLEPKVTALIAKFFEPHVQLKSRVDWEPRYNLAPVPFIDVQMVSNARPPEAAKEKDKEAPKKDAPAAPAAEAPKPKEAAPGPDAAPPPPPDAKPKGEPK
jgi:pimeloyl-ACP methyl ester carboxylesterase